MLLPWAHGCTARLYFLGSFAVGHIMTNFLSVEGSGNACHFHILAIRPWACNPPFFLSISHRLEQGYNNDPTITVNIMTNPRRDRVTIRKEPGPMDNLPKQSYAITGNWLDYYRRSKLWSSDCRLESFCHSSFSFTLTQSVVKW